MAKNLSLIFCVEKEFVIVIINTKEIIAISFNWILNNLK